MPYRADLKALVREYVRWTIEEAWAKQRQGIMPELDGPNPVAGDLWAHGAVRTWHAGPRGDSPDGAQTVRLIYRSPAHTLISSGMPHVMWYTVALGALINMIFLWLFDLRVSTHLLLGRLVSFFTAIMIYVIAILDTPFGGEIGVSPEALQLVYRQMQQD